MKRQIKGVLGINADGHFYIAGQGGEGNEPAKTRLAQLAIELADKGAAPITAIHFVSVTIEGLEDPPAPKSMPSRLNRDGQTVPLSPAELAIGRALSMVEEMPAHTRLTDASVALQQAIQHVRAYLDQP